MTFSILILIGLLCAAGFLVFYAGPKIIELAVTERIKKLQEKQNKRLRG